MPKEGAIMLRARQNILIYEKDHNKKRSRSGKNGYDISIPHFPDNITKLSSPVSWILATQQKGKTVRNPKKRRKATNVAC